jgi:hypothetical protein
MVDRSTAPLDPSTEGRIGGPTHHRQTLQVEPGDAGGFLQTALAPDLVLHLPERAVAAPLDAARQRRS